MAIVLIDVSAFSKDWFRRIIKQLGKSSGVRFLFTDQEKYLREVGGVVPLATFLKEMKNKGRRIDVPSADVQELMDNLGKHATWIANAKVCDDPHLFAITTLGRGKYIFTDEKRLAKCRGCMVPVKADICGFKTIRSEAVYKKHRSKVFKA
ncbi:hypothetical protein [Ensifer adhaerens]|uniref:hypothetical protein n=1 Tax=Ensifer adhaerens TaxID=106592 RepID=UPI00098E8B28|nr:hypothetical protein [Ensifer adhaerens]